MADPEQKTEEVQGHCPSCGSHRWADVVREYIVEEKDDHVWAVTKHRVLRCRGCRTVYFQEVHVFSEDYYYVDNPNTGELEIEYEEKVTYWPCAFKAQPAGLV